MAQSKVVVLSCFDETLSGKIQKELNRMSEEGFRFLNSSVTSTKPAFESTSYTVLLFFEKTTITTY
jgi:hypothetical protein